MQELYRQGGNRAKGTGERWLAAALVLLAWGLLMSSVVRKSPTVDEQSHLFRGVAYLKTGATHFRLGHPILGGVLAAFPVLTEPALHLPVDDPSWTAGDWSVAGDAFLWQMNQNPQRIIFLGRLPSLFLTLLLGSLVCRWGSQLAHGPVGLLAMILLLLDPNLMAHGRLITSDLAVTAFFTLAVYGFWRWSRNGTSGTLILAGAGSGLAAATKYNAVLLAPVLGLLGAVLAAGVWGAASLGLTYYLANFGNYNKVYGSIGAVMALLMWLYVSAFSVLLGAALNAELAERKTQDL